MIAFRQLALQRGIQPLIENADLTLHDRTKAGVVGANGSGKSSLFKLLLGELTPERGTVELSGGQRIAHMAQEVEALDRALVEHVLDGHTELRATELPWPRLRRAERFTARPSYMAKSKRSRVIPRARAPSRCW